MSEWKRSSFCATSECVEVRDVGDTVQLRGGTAIALGSITVTDAGNTCSAIRAGYAYTREEWAAFVAGVKAGEFDVEVKP